MPKLQIDGVDVAEIDAYQAATLTRQLGGATRAAVSSIKLELRNLSEYQAVLSEPPKEVEYENGIARIEVRWETRLSEKGTQ